VRLTAGDHPPGDAEGLDPEGGEVEVALPVALEGGAPLVVRWYAPIGASCCGSGRP
jgi:hypothetical protein